MRSKNTWITLVTLAAATIDIGVGQSRFENGISHNQIEIPQTQRRLLNARNLKNAAIHDYTVNGSRIDTRESFGDLFENTMKEFVPFSDVNEKCTTDGRHYAESYNNHSTWAVQMFDSSSKYPGGIYTGKVTEMGDFDRCISVSSKQFRIEGAYVSMNIEFHPAKNSAFVSESFDKKHQRTSMVSFERDWLTTGPDSMLWSLCVPDSCSGDDVRMSVDRALKSTFRNRNITVNVTVPPLMYTSKSTALEYSNGFYFICVMAIGCVSLAVIGTLYASLTDDRSRPGRKNGIFKECLRSYSIIENMKSLMDGSKSGEHNVVHGFKCIGIIQIIIHHRRRLVMATPSSNPVFYDHIYDNFWLGFLKSQVPVEIFFVISGFLMYVLIHNRLSSGSPLKIFSIIFFRIIRLWPTYITVILVFAFVLPYTGDGPFWKSIVYPEAEFCRKNWWTNLLFINTYVDSYNMCMFHSWYLACDVHYFVIGVLLTFLIKRWKKVGFGIFGIVFVLSVYTPAKYIYDYKQWGLIPTLRGNGMDVRQNEHFHRVYIKSEFRFTTYLVGIVTAYIYVLVKNSKPKMLATYSKFTGCITCFFLMYFCMAITGYFYLPGIEYNPWHHVLYFTFQRITYALCVSYLIVVSQLSDFGFIGSIFQSQLCIFVSKLSYIAYLIHVAVQVNNVGQIRQPQHMNTWILCEQIAMDLITTLSFSVIINLLVEFPSRRIINFMKSKFFDEPDNFHERNENGKITIKQDINLLPLEVKN